MEDVRKTKKQLIEELQKLRQSVTKLKGFEEEVKQTRVNQEKFAKAFLQNSIPAVITKAKEGRFVEVSDAFLRLVELKRDEVVGHTSREIGFLTEEQTYSFFNELGKYGRIENLEMEIRPKGGGVRYVLFNAVMISINNENYLLTSIQNITKRKQLENTIQEMTAELQETVSRRTLELNKTNRRLQKEITERKQTEATLQDSIQRNKALLDANPDMFFVFSADGRIVDAKAERSDDFYVPPADFLGKRIEDVLPPDLAQQTLDRIAETNRTGRLVQYNYTLGLHGKEKDFESRLVPCANGTAMAVVRDITERNKTEAALRESEEKYRLLFENAGEGILIAQGDMIKFANPALTEILGYPRDIITTRPFSSFIHPDDCAMVIDNHVRRMRGEPMETGYRFRIIDADGNERWLHIISRILSWEGMPASLSFVMNITDNRLMEEALRGSEERFKALFEKSLDAQILMDHEGKVIDCNDAFIELFCLRGKSEVIGHRPSDFAPELQLNGTPSSEMGKKIRTAILEKGSAKFEWSHQKHDLTRTPILTELSCTLIQIADCPMIYVVIRDITARKQAEEEKRSLEERLNRAQKMEALGQLAGGVAHDLNNVLGILSGYSELLLLEITEGSKARGHVEKILQSTVKGAAIIDDLLTLARRGVSVSNVVNLNSVVLDFLRSSVLEKIKDYHSRVNFRTECQDELLNIKGSPLHLEKTLMNLVSNAAESISGIGEVIIRTESRYLEKTIRGYDEIKEGDYAVLTVSDTGMGIPAENREKIFEPFYTKKAMGRSGTGLGLAIVWGTVKDHNGYIDIQTEIGKGTTFTLYFPLTREEMIAPLPKEPIESYIGKGESVFVVDDIAEQRDIAARLLTQLGYQVHSISSGEEAVEYLKTNKADILVLDMIMEPGIDGLETYKRVLAINPKQKAIIVSGFSETERVKEAQKLGAGAYVKKPYVMEKIGVAIRDELKR